VLWGLSEGVASKPLSKATCRLVDRSRMGHEAHVRICGGCALQAHEIQPPEMAAVVKLSQQLRTESCVVAGNGPCEA